MKKKAVVAAIMIACVISGIIYFQHVTQNAIEGEWVISTVVDENGTTILCSSEEQANWPDAKKSAMTLCADKNQLVITDDGNIYTGSYEYNKSNLAGTIYDVVIVDNGIGYQGLAVAGYQFVWGGDSDRVLTISVLVDNKNVSLFFEKN